MAVRAVVRIPTPLRPYTGGADELAVEAASVREALARLGSEHEGLLERILDEEGEPRPFVNLFRGSEDVRTLAGLDTPLRDGDVVSILPAVAGGRGTSFRSRLPTNGG